MPKEQQCTELASEIGESKLRFRADATTNLIAVRITTPSYNATAYVTPERLTLAVAAVVDLPRP